MRRTQSDFRVQFLFVYQFPVNDTTKCKLELNEQFQSRDRILEPGKAPERIAFISGGRNSNYNVEPPRDDMIAATYINPPEKQYTRAWLFLDIRGMVGFDQFEERRVSFVPSRVAKVRREGRSEGSVLVYRGAGLALRGLAIGNGDYALTEGGTPYVFTGAPKNPNLNRPWL